jgi:hypothetical protein
MAYTTFESIGGGENGTEIGELPIEDIAEALAYRKALEVQVFLDPGDFGVSFKDLTGRWRVRVRLNGNRDSTGAYTAPIIFEQTIEWTARVFALALGGGLTLVTWQPLGDGGSGKQQTSIVAGQACAVVDDVNDLAQMAAYGATGAWRFLDTVSFLPTATPRHKFDAEKGFTIFTAEGAATVGGYSFHAVYQSPYYRYEAPNRSILETVFDNWQSSLLTEARYTVSQRKGASGEALLFDERTGAHWRLFVDRLVGTSRLQIIRSRQVRGVLERTDTQFGQGISLETEKLDDGDNGVLETDTRLRGIQLKRLPGGAMIAVGATGGQGSLLRAFVTTDEGENWERVMNQLLNINPLAMCVLKDAARMLVYGTNEQGNAAYSLLSFGKVTLDDGSEDNGWRAVEGGTVTGPAGVTMPTRNVSLTIGDGGVVRLLSRDATAGTLLTLISRDSGKSYEKEATS